jgi:DNA-directed RNA polymerase subunit RPC12/RpoP
MAHRRRFAIALVLCLAGFFLVGYGVWSFQAGHLMVLVYVGLSALAYLIYAFAARCPHCRWPVLLRPRRWLGMDIFTWSILPPTRCRHCGRPLE